MTSPAGVRIYSVLGGVRVFPLSCRCSPPFFCFDMRLLWGGYRLGSVIDDHYLCLDEHSTLAVMVVALLVSGFVLASC